MLLPSTGEAINNFRNDPAHLNVEPIYGLTKEPIDSKEAVSLADPNYLYFLHPFLALDFVQQLGGEQAELATRMIRKALMKTCT